MIVYVSDDLLSVNEVDGVQSRVEGISCLQQVQIGITKCRKVEVNGNAEEEQLNFLLFFGGVTGKHEHVD